MAHKLWLRSACTVIELPPPSHMTNGDNAFDEIDDRNDKAYLQYKGGAT